MIRVETATRICVTRLLPPYPRDMEFGPNRSGYFNQYNQGKKSLTLDLKRPEAVAVAKRLCAASDVVVENFAAGVMDRMGLGYDVLRALRPDVVMIALSGYGATGPDCDKVSYGPAQVPLHVRQPVLAWVQVEDQLPLRVRSDAGEEGRPVARVVDGAEAGRCGHPFWGLVLVEVTYDDVPSPTLRGGDTNGT